VLELAEAEMPLALAGVHEVVEVPDIANCCGFGGTFSLNTPSQPSPQGGGSILAVHGGLVCWHTMRRTTIKLPDEVDLRLRHEAERRGTTVSALSREAIQAYLDMRPRRVLAGGKAWRSGRHDVSERIEAILREEMAG
jgi:predicted transcriptional regulator